MQDSLIKYLFELRNIKNKGINYIYGENKEEFISYHDLYIKSKTMAQYLKKIPFDKIVLQIQETREFIYSVWACLFANKVIIPIKFSESKEQANVVYNILNMSEKNGVILDKENDLLNDAIVDKKVIWLSEILSCDSDFEYDSCENSNWEDPILIQFSSGSTGKPKGVITTNKNLILNMNWMIEEYSYGKQDKNSEAKIIDWIPLTHNLGMIVGHFATVMRGIDEYVIPTKMFIANPMLLLEKIDEHRITTFHSPNFGLDLISKCAANYDKKELDLSCLSVISIGAERVSSDSCENFIKCMSKFNMPSTAVQPGYGLSEATVIVSDAKNRDFVARYLNRNKLSIGDRIEEIDKTDSRAVCFVEVGKVYGCCKLIVTDDDGQILEDGYVGRIKLKGDTISQGYYLGENKIGKLEVDDLGWFDTGDIGFVINNFLTIIGRSKDVIIINGKNVYPNDFEAIICESLNIPKAFVAVTGIYNNAESVDEIVAFIKNNIANVEDATNIVKRKVKNRTGYNIKDVVFIDEIPKTSNGKIMRYKLVEMYNSKNNGNDKKANKKKLVSKVMRIIREVIEDDTIEATDEIFDYNISSIKIMRIVSLIKTKLGYDGKIKNWINSETFHDFIKTLREGKEEVSELIALESNNQYNEFELSSVQMAYLVGRNADFELGNTSTHAYIEIEANLDIEKFNNSVQKVIEKQPMLRTIVMSSGKQKILEKVEPYNIEVIDISSKDKVEKEKIIVEERHKTESFVFDANKWPLFEFKAIKLDENLYELMFGIDMLIADGASIQLIFKQIYDVYNGKELRDKRVTFKDYIMYIKNLKNSSKYIADKKYWETKVRDMESPANLPLKNRIGAVKTPLFGRKSYSLDKEKWRILTDNAQKNNVRVTYILLYAYAKVLSKWSNQRKLTINTTVFNRPQIHEDINSIVGDFTTLMLVTIDTDKYKNIYKAAKYVQDEFLDSIEHKDYDGVNVVRDYCKYNNISFKSAVMPIVFTSMLFGENNEFNNFVEKIGQVKHLSSQTSQVYLDYQVTETENEVLLTWDYVKNLFDEDVINAMFKDYIIILDSLVSNIAEVQLKNAAAEEIYKRYNNTEFFIEEDTLHGMFKKQCEVTPDNIAVKLKEKSLTYKELDEKSDKLAAYLLNKGIGKGKYVAIITERKIESIINILGILKTGAAYVPINIDYPKERIENIKDETGSFDILDSFKCRKILDTPEIISSNNFVYNNTNDVAYIIYTSGSTGKPKGVVIKHSAAVNTIKDINNRFKVGEKDKIIGLSSLSFDLSVYDVFGALSCGAELVLVEEQRDMEEVDHIVREDKITIWNSVPMIMEMYVNYLSDKEEEVIDFDNIPEITTVLLSGDWIPVNLPNKIKNKFIDCEVISLGGATEASIWSIYYPIEDVKENWTSIPYGYPLGNQKYYVLDYDKQICPINVKGELYIGGVGLANGYFKDEEKTNNSFIDHEEYGRIYKTGDIGVMTHKGWIEFLGREDSQVKIRGYRIEITEIETEILKYSGIKKVVVINSKDSNNIAALYGFVVSDEIIDLNNLRYKLSERLPDYMIPEYLIQIEDIPLMQNGKISRKKLIEIKNERLKNVSYKELIKPENEIEKKLVRLWESILKIDKVNIVDNFFEQGGNSILTIKLISMIEKEFKLKISFKTFLTNCSIKKLAQVIDNEIGKVQIDFQTVEKIRDDVFKISGGVNDSNAYIIKNNKHAVLIDAGCAKEKIEKLLDYEDCSLSAIILTHAHCDHIYYADELRKLNASRYVMHIEEKEFANDMDNNGMNAVEREFTLDPKDIFIGKEKEIIEIDDLRYEVYHTPGHTKGSICVKYKDLIFTGDTVVPDSEEIPDLHYGDEVMLKNTKNYILNNFDDDLTVCAGHGDICRLGSIKK
ncbi:non-ribosomal peptide synthetase [Clostridium felsineum]|uniref:non-ribosomal peptide synthetase n=1 Tax=Clostridium felsineum TaxID=36839 RepID=UPI00098CC6E5|nr:non-ribosomal peptide synthetase [Clostridium felsineum]URZ14548.1 Polyketide synthase PksJ [Clostridium felsineum DSM 794]